MQLSYAVTSFHGNVRIECFLYFLKVLTRHCFKYFLLARTVCKLTIFVRGYLKNGHKVMNGNIRHICLRDASKDFIHQLERLK